MSESKDGKTHGECGLNEAVLFEYLDGDLDPVRVRAFESHLDACAPCRKELSAYRSLASALSGLPSLEPKARFDEDVLAAVLPSPRPMPAVSRIELPGLVRWFAALPAPLRAYASAGAIMALVVLTFLTVYTERIGGPEKLANRAIVQATQAGAGVVTDGANNLLAAVKFSDVLMDLAVIMRPIARSLSLAFNAVGPEFWLLTMLLSILALVGAVRLASGPAVGGGGHRVSLLC